MESNDRNNLQLKMTADLSSVFSQSQKYSVILATVANVSVYCVVVPFANRFLMNASHPQVSLVKQTPERES